MAKAKYSYNEKRKEWYTLVWDGTYAKDGSKHRKRIASKKSSADLERKVSDFKASVEQGRNVEYSAMTFFEYAMHWLKVAKATKELNTQAMYRNIITVHLAFLADTPLTEIRHSHFQQAINNQMEHPRTCQQISITFRQIVKMAVRDRLLPKSALDDVLVDISLPTYQKAEKRPLSAVELEALRKVELDARKAAFVFILYYCGLRKGEALALTRFDFSWSAMTISVNKVIVFDNGKPVLKDYPKSDNGIRKVPIPADAVEKIRPFVELCQDKFLFHGRDNEMMTAAAYRRMWDSIIMSMNRALGYNPHAKDRGLPQITDLTAHIFRHNYCTQLCYQVPKISTKMIARLLGDTEKMVLEVYSHIVEEKEEVEITISEAMAL